MQGDEMKYNRGNYDKYMSGNPLKQIMIQNLNGKIINKLKAFVQEMPGKRIVKILDAGCGEGFMMKLMAANIQNAEIVGLEYTKEALAVAEKMNPQLKYVQGDICKMPFDNASFDIVVCTEVLEHLANPRMALKELRRVSRKYILFTVPNEPWFCLGNLMVLKNVSRMGNPIDHINHWTYSGFKRFLGKYMDGNCVYEKSFPWTMAYYTKRQK